MSSKWKICKTCGEIYVGENNNRIICPDCSGELFLVETNMPSVDVFSLTDISNDFNFTKSMMELYDINPIEYQLKIGQFKQQINNNKPKCPTCNSTNIEKISVGKKAVGGFMFGLLSSDVRKTMHCKNCGYKW